MNLLNKPAALRPAARETPLRLKARRFHRMLENFAEFNGLLQDALEKQGGEFVIDRQYLASLIDRAFGLARETVCDTAILRGRKYYRFYYTTDLIKTKLRRVLAWRPRIEGENILIPFSDIDELDHYHEVGGVFTRLSEVRQRLGLLIPDGFVITFMAFDQFVKYNGLEQYMCLADALPSRAAAMLRDKIRDAEMPAELRAQIEEAVTRLSAIFGSPLKFIVTGAAFGEEYSRFAGGEYRTLAAVGAGEILDAYKSVVAGMFSERAVADRISQGLEPECFPAISVSRMIPSEMDGVIQTINPDAPGHGLMRITVNRAGESETHEVRRSAPYEIVSSRGDPPGTRIPLAARDMAGLADKAMRIERYFKGAQEIVWARDDKGDTYIIRTKPLAIRPETSVSSSELAAAVRRHEALYEQKGKVACPGIADGKVHLVINPGDMEKLPDRGVIVAESIEPGEELVRALPRAAAILTGKSEPTGHAAALAREFHVPTITGLGDVISALAREEMVTVDADENAVYRGAVAELLNYQLWTSSGLEHEKEYNLLRFILHRLSSAGVAGGRTRRARLKARETLDGIVRYCMDVSCESISDDMKAFKPAAAADAPNIENELGLRIRVIDAGGGIEAATGKHGKTVSNELLLSRPFVSFWKGLSSAPFPIAVNGGSALAILMRERMFARFSIGTRTFAIGALQSNDSRDDYIYGRVSDSAPLDDGNRRRIMWMKGLLEKAGFTTYLMNDGVTAWRCGLPPLETPRALSMIGGMIGYAGKRDATEPGGKSVEEEMLSFMDSYRDAVLAQRP